MQVNVTIPAFNEERLLRENVLRLHAFLGQKLRFRWNIIIADNGSTDRTLEIGHSLQEELPRISVVHLDEKGRGHTLKHVWLQSDADVLSYMDADLSSDLNAFPALIEALAGGGYDIATGSRLLRHELTTRCLKREVASRCYNSIIKRSFATHFSDAQCGFKALTRRAAQHLLPLVEDPSWFFDTELLVLAEKLGYRIFDLPVRWVENRDSHVRIFRTAVDDLKGLWRLHRRLRRGVTPLAEPPH